MTWIVLLVACLVAVGLVTVAVWILVGWTPAAAEPSDRLDRLRSLQDMGAGGEIIYRRRR